MTTELSRPITIYKLATGQIMQCIAAKLDREIEQCAEDEGWILGSYSDADYRVDPLTQEAKPLHEYAVIIETNRISNIPPGTSAIVSGQAYEIGDDGEIEFELALPQTIRLSLSNPLYRAPGELFAIPCEPVAP